MANILSIPVASYPFRLRFSDCGAFETIETRNGLFYQIDRLLPTSLEIVHSWSSYASCLRYHMSPRTTVRCHIPRSMWDTKNFFSRMREGDSPRPMQRKSRPRCKRGRSMYRVSTKRLGKSKCIDLLCRLHIDSQSCMHERHIHQVFVETHSLQLLYLSHQPIEISLTSSIEGFRINKFPPATTEQWRQRFFYLVDLIENEVDINQCFEEFQPWCALFLTMRLTSQCLCNENLHISELAERKNLSLSLWYL